VARSIANSPLVKTAFFGQDPNWGRILCAAGYSGVPLNADKVDIDFDDEPIVCRGQGVGGLQEKRAGAVMKKKEYSVRLHLHRGSKQSSVFTTDFSFDYIKINASYRS